MVLYDAGDHFEQIFLLYFDAGGRSLLIGDCLENCWLATSNSCIKAEAVDFPFPLPQKKDRFHRFRFHIPDQHLITLQNIGVASC